MRHNRARELRTQGLSIIQLAGLQKFMIAFMILALMSLPFVQPVQKKEEAKTEEAKSFGDMTVLITWPDKLDIDIDLWALCVSDEQPVGYSNRAGKTCNLQRDDLGKPNDSTDLNFEMVSTRGLPSGEYIVNIHYFMNHELGVPEVPVTVVVSTKAQGVGGMKEIITRKAVLRNLGEELTVVRFTIDANGELVKDSVNDFYQELRSWQPRIQ
jgi:hypothetical protein